jgi:hypothetical protein
MLPKVSSLSDSYAKASESLVGSPNVDAGGMPVKACRR